MAVPASLLVDDGAPVNLMVWHCTWQEHVRVVPNVMLRDFAGLCERHGVSGKFSIPPMPAALGRIDQQLSGVRPAHLRKFLDIARRRIAPRFDITCELLTHLAAFNVRGGYFEHVYEDAWVGQADADQIAETIALALKILDSVGLRSTGVTSPWSTGVDNEKAYAQGIARAFWRVHRRKRSWYFLHCMDESRPAWPWVAWKDAGPGLETVTVPANTRDVFWPTQYATSLRAARAAARAGADELLSRDGRSGTVRKLVDAGFPVTILTHWQSMFSNGRLAGLWGLELLLERMAAHLGDEIRWMRCSELARLARPRPRHA